VFIEPYAAPPLGLLDLADGWCRASVIPVGDGDQLLLYTDGVSEARDAAGRFFPLAQVTAEALAGQEAPRPHGAGRSALLDALVTSLDAHIGDRRSDDILLLLVTMRLSAVAPIRHFSVQRGASSRVQRGASSRVRTAGWPGSGQP
jgi:hypothetical protein